MLPRLAPFALLAILSSTCFAHAALAAPSLDGVSLGEPVCGPKLSPKEVRGRVVVFEYWGVNCPPCLASIPHLAEIQNKYPYNTLLMIANQCQDSDAKNAAKVWAEHGGGKKAFVVNHGGLTGANVTGIPHVFVFSHLGKLVFDGNPHDAKFADAIAAAVKNSPGAGAMRKLETARDNAKAIVGKDIPEELETTVLVLCMADRSATESLRKLEAASKNKDLDIAKGAGTMLANFKAYVGKESDKLDALKTESPSAAKTLADKLALWVPQLEAGAKARKQLADWAKDKAFPKEVAADKILVAMRIEAEKINFEKNAEAKPSGKLKDSYRDLLKFYPTAQATPKAEAMAEKWKLEKPKL